MQTGRILPAEVLVDAPVVELCEHYFLAVVYTSVSILFMPGNLVLLMSCSVMYTML